MTIAAFLGDTQIAAGERAEVQKALECGYLADLAAITVFDADDGSLVDLDYWDASRAGTPKSRGRPNLGVRAREVTLLPRHWEWLARQPGGASAALRRLVEEARRTVPDTRARQNAAYNFMRHTCGNRPGYEEALRTLYRDDREGFDAAVADWPRDVRLFIARLRGE